MDNWVLIPCHNNSALLIEGLRSIMAQTIPVRIMAINNGSVDNVPFVLKSLGDDHIIINAYPQLGVSGAWNYGLSHLFSKEGAGQVLVVNQDIELRPETYEELNGDSRPFNTAVSVGSREELSSYQRREHYSARPHPDFSCFRVTKRVYETVGPFDEGFYPAWFEDNDYHIRAAISGIELQCIDIPFYHYAAGTMKTATEYDKAHYYGPGFLKSKERFQSKWGCLPGTKQYEEMCSPAYWTSQSSLRHKPANPTP